MERRLEEGQSLVWDQLLLRGMTLEKLLDFKKKAYFYMGKGSLAKKEYQDNKYVVAGAVGFLTAITDLFIHPTHFGGPQTEAIVTGIGAGLLCLALSYIKSDNK
jgi:hypothetical protein